MFIIEKDPEKDRPAFEQEGFETKASAIARAKELARQYQTFVVVCG
ncbi:MAG: hypothetical protein M0036_00050 [Desulfobacteraceae bacterium]|nr:hypothetical protein [Desulfobacteraceae bacterium]